MSKKYTNGRRRDKENNDSEILGIILVIISAFILLCIFIPPILGSISKKAIYPVITGFFGLFAYPLFLCMLLGGIALIQGRHTDLPARYKAGIICSVIALMLILQLATTHSILVNSFSSYISATYRKTTAGGVLFGIFAYGIQRAITPVVSYILFSILFLLSLGFFILMPIISKRMNAQKSNESAEIVPFVKGMAQARGTRPLGDNTLYVDTIRVPQNSQFAPLNELNQQPTPPQIQAEPGQSGLLGTQNKQGVQFQSYSKVNSSQSDSRSDARKILFGDTQSIIDSTPHSNISRSDFRREQEEYRNNYTLPPLSASPDVIDRTSAPEPEPAPKPPVQPEKPQKRVHYPGFDVPMVPPKDFSNEIVGSDGIVNGEDLSRKLAESIEPPLKETEEEFPKAREFNTKKVEFSTVVPKETQPAEPEQSAIVNGDYFGSPEKKSPKPQQTEIRQTSVQEPVRNDSVEIRPYIPEAEEKIPEPEPIINASRYERENSVESRFQMLLNEDRQRNQRSVPEVEKEPQIEFDSIEDEDDAPLFEPVPDLLKAIEPEEDENLIAETLPEQPRQSSFNIIEEAVDLSEKSHFEGEDSTGYYDSVSVAPRPAPMPPVQKLKLSNQIKIDDYVASAPVPTKPKKKKHVHYNAPDIDMLIASDATAPENYNVACEEKARLLEETLQGLKLPAKVGAITRGPAVTRYELEMPPGIPIKRIEQFSADIEYNLASNGKIRIETPIPGKRAVGIEVPNEMIDIVCLRDIIASKEFQNSSSPLTLSLGKDIAGSNIICNLEKMPHLLIAGATGSGKSACLNSIIMSIMYKASPEDVRMILIDPKRVEFNLYQGIPHLLSSDIINDAQQAINALTWAKEEMDRRYMLFGSNKVRNLPEYNKSEVVKSGEEPKLPYIVLIVDELAELMLDNNKKVLETKIMSMAQKARAAGIHLILATQRPSVDVITGTIKANLPSRIAFSVKSIVDSRTILDQCGAETLLGRGDMLYAPIGLDDPKRVQGAFVTEQEISAVTEYVRANNEKDFDEEFTATITKRDDEPESDDGDEEDSKEFDSLMPDVLKCVIESGAASTSMIQRRFSVGYARASRIIDQMELHKFIGPLEGSKPRAVYISREQYKELFGIDL